MTVQMCVWTVGPWFADLIVNMNAQCGYFLILDFVVNVSNTDGRWEYGTGLLSRLTIIIRILSLTVYSHKYLCVEAGVGDIRGLLGSWWRKKAALHLYTGRKSF